MFQNSADTDKTETGSADGGPKDFVNTKYLDTGRGKLNITSTYTRYTSLDKCDYYKAKYVIQTVPTGDSRTGETLIETTGGNRAQHDNQKLLTYGPTTTVGTSTATVELSTGLSLSGPEVGLSQGWSYAIPDVAVYDYSDMSSYGLKIRHDIDQDRNVGSCTYKCEPGAVYAVDKGDSFVTVDTYSVMFFKVKHFLWCSWLDDLQNYSTSISISIPVATVFGN